MGLALVNKWEFIGRGVLRAPAPVFYQPLVLTLTWTSRDALQQEIENEKRERGSTEVPEDGHRVQEHWH